MKVTTYIRQFKIKWVVMMIKHISLLGLLVFFMNEVAYAETAKRLAIIEAKNSSNLKSSDLADLSNMFYDLAKKLPKNITIVKKESILPILRPHQALADCTDQCEVTIGRKIGADLILTSEVLSLSGKMGIRLIAMIHETKNGGLVAFEVYDGPDLVALEKDLRSNQEKDIFRLFRPSGIIAVAKESVRSENYEMSTINLNIAGNKQLAIKACANENIEECVRLGFFELNGKNKEESKKYFDKSCTKGNIEGCGMFKYIEGDKKSARKYFTQLCDGGKISGCRDLGHLEYEQGDKVSAEKLWTIACNDGNMVACSDLGHLEEDHGSKEVAKQAYSKACEGGDIWGCYYLGHLERIQGNKDTAKRYFTKACDGGFMIGCDGRGFTEEQQGDKEEAKKYYTRACDGGYMTGCVNLGHIESVQGNKEIAKKYYIKACDGGEMGGCRNLAAFEDKRGNKDDAKKYYIKACNGGELVGCYQLGRIEETQGNKDAAKRYLIKACEGGYKAACKS